MKNVLYINKAEAPFFHLRVQLLSRAVAYVSVVMLYNLEHASVGTHFLYTRLRKGLV